MPKSIDERMLERLDLIVKVLSLQVGADRSLTERVRLLKLVGLDNSTIARVLGTTPNAVRAMASNLKEQSARVRALRK